MSRKMTGWCVSILAIVLMGMAWSVSAAEHPTEHPKEQPSAEKPAEPLTKEALAKEIKAYVKEDSALKGGYFLVYDSEAEKALVLTLAKVHEDRLSAVGKDTYFACADFETPDGKIYDLDIFMKGPGKGRMKVTKILVHKEDDEPRYNWYEEGGVWKTKSVKEEAEETEHPSEHPVEGGAPEAGSDTKADRDTKPGSDTKAGSDTK